VTKPTIPEDAEIRAVTDHNGNVCGYLFGRYELPWPLIEMIEKDVPTTGYHGVNYHTRPLNDGD
jgi:hypothetical protein